MSADPTDEGSNRGAGQAPAADALTRRSETTWGTVADPTAAHARPHARPHDHATAVGARADDASSSPGGGPARDDPSATSGGSARAPGGNVARGAAGGPGRPGPGARARAGGRSVPRGRIGRRRRGGDPAAAPGGEGDGASGVRVGPDGRIDPRADRLAGPRRRRRRRRERTSGPGAALSPRASPGGR